MMEPLKKSLQVLVICEQCGLLFRTLDRHVGAQAPCPSCGQMLRITAGTRIRAPVAATSSMPTMPLAEPAADPFLPIGGTSAVTAPADDGGAATAGAAVNVSTPAPSAAAAEVASASIPPPLPSMTPPPVVTAPPILAKSVAAGPGSDRATWGCLLTGLAAFTLFAGGMLVLVAAIVAVVPPPNEDWAQQKWSGVVCSLLAATVFVLPGVWLLRRGLAMRGAKG